MKFCNTIRNVFNRIINRLTFFKRKVKRGHNLLIDGIINIYGYGYIEIGNNVTINSSRIGNPIGGDISTTIYCYKNCKLIIGNNVGMSNVSIVVRKEIVIEDDVIIGGGVKIYDSDFHSLDYNKRMIDPYLDICDKKVLIRKGAFIGAHSIILKGVTIGQKSIIGAGSVVTKSVSDNEIWAGNPAKFIRKCD